MALERTPETSSRGISQGWALVIVAGVLVAVGLTWYLTGSSAEPTPIATPSPADFSLTDEEAIARFKELEAAKLHAYRRTDPSLLSTIFTSDSPSRRLVERDFKKLEANGVRFRTSFVTTSIELVRNDGGGIVVRQTVIVRPRFLQGGGDVTTSEPQEQVVDWVIKRQGDQWLVHETLVRDTRELNA